MKEAVTVENLSVSFSDIRVLRQITCKVEEGEIFGLLGPSGAGKTTLAKVLTGQLVQNGGVAKLFGKDTRKLGTKEREQIGIMMDCFGLYDRLSVYDNLAFYADIYRVPKSRIWGILKSIGLEQAGKTAVQKLSKGMKSRLSLARALMRDAKILFLDEPTCGLDPVTAREIHAVLEEQRRKGTTVFLTTHNMYEAHKLCDHVALLHEGVIVEYGNPAKICGKYNRLQKLLVTLKDGKTVVLENGSSAALPMKEYLEAERVETVHSTEPTLEDVFVELTGKELGADA